MKAARILFKLTASVQPLAQIPLLGAVMFKWFRIVRWIREMRKKYGRYDFRVVTSDTEIIFYIDKEEDELRVRY